MAKKKTKRRVKPTKKVIAVPKPARKNSRAKSSLRWFLYIFVMAAGIAFMVQGFFIQQYDLLYAFLCYFVGIILLRCYKKEGLCKNC